MTILPSKIILICLILPSLAFGQIIDNVIIKGNKIFSESEYIDWSGVKPGDSLGNISPDSVKKSILINLSDRGYFHAGISINTDGKGSDSLKINLLINVVENFPTYIARFVYDIDSTLAEKFNSILQYYEGEIFNRAELEDGFDEILDYYENIGYPFASVKIQSIQISVDSSDGYGLADIYLKFNKNETSTIDEIKITGLTKTKNYVIKRNIRIKEGDKYSQDKIDEIPKLLNRLSYFEPVSEPGYYFNSDNKGVLHINVRDKPTNNFDGIIGYIPPSNSNDEGFFTGFVKIGLRNIFGTEREALFRWQKEGPEIQELEISYLEPWLFGYPFNIRAGLFQRQQDTTFVQRKLSGNLQFLATDIFSASLLLSTESTIPSLTDSGKFTVYNSSAIETGANIKIDSRDNIYAPTEGIYFISTYKYSSKTINGPDEFITPGTVTEDNLQRLELDFLYFLTSFKRQVLSFGIHGRELTGNNIEQSDLYRLGGTNTVRGYRENQFLGNRMLWSNLEYRYLLSSLSYAFIFFDAAYYLRNADETRNIERTAEFKYGYGLGITFETALGIMGVSFALGKGDPISEGKIHVGIVNEF